jgi:hypothetical protein
MLKCSNSAEHDIKPRLLNEGGVFYFVPLLLTFTFKFFPDRKSGNC